MAKKFVPMQLPARPFQEVVRGPSSKVTPEVVVPIRSSDLHRDPRLLFDVANLPKPRTIFPMPQPDPGPDPNAVPPGPTADEVAAMVREAEEKGYRQGRASMQDELNKKVEQEKRLGQVADAVDALRLALIQEVRDDVGHVVVAAIEHLAGALPEALSGLLERRLSEACEQLASARNVVVYVRPVDVPLARTHLSHRPQWEVREDRSLRGGCRVVSEGGLVDGSLNAALGAVLGAAADWRADGEGARGR